ncbi:hypothetical protein Tco_0192972 [Tanacetum coccineum]
MPQTSSDQLADNLYDVMMETLPSLVKEKVTDQVKKEEQQHQLYLAMKADPLLQQTACRSSAVHTRDQDEPHDDASLEGENSAKRQTTSEYEAYVSRESSSEQVNVEEQGPSTLVTQDIMEEISLTIDEAKLKKMADEMCRNM